MKIDVFCHFFPKPFYDKMLAISGTGAVMQKRVRNIPAIHDLEARFRTMDPFPEYAQVLSLPAPPLEDLAAPEKSPELAQIANDGFAELVSRHTGRFPGFIASLPMNNPEAAAREAERAATKLGAAGVQIFSNVSGRPLDDPAFLPIFEKMAALDLPIWLHPARQANFPDYLSEKESKLEMWWVFGWPYETSVAMARLVYTGYFDRWPNLKIITHHSGAMIPSFAGRIGPGLDQLGARTSDKDLTVYSKRLKKRAFDYFKMYYADTATFGALGALACALDFFGPDQVLFASDSPFDPEGGTGYIRETIRCIEALPVSAADRKKIYEGNARKLFGNRLAV